MQRPIQILRKTIFDEKKSNITFVEYKIRDYGKHIFTTR